MHMSFDWSANIGEFLIPGLTINSVTSLTLLCGIIFLFCITFEGMKVHQARTRARAAREIQRAHSTAPSETATLLTDHGPNTSSSSGGAHNTFGQRFAKVFSDAFFFVIHNTFMFLLMLTVMGYNGFIFISVVLGLGCGYFFFGHLSMKVNMENVQARQRNVVCTARPATAPVVGCSGVSVDGASTSNESTLRTNQLQSVTTEANTESRDSSSEPEVTDFSRL